MSVSTLITDAENSPASGARPLIHGQTLARFWLRRCFFAAALCFVCGTPAAQAASAPQPADAKNSQSVAAEVAEPPPIPLAEVAIEAESVSTRIAEILAEATSERVELAAEQLPPLTREIDARLRETRRILAQEPSIEVLNDLQENWRPLQRHLSGWTRDLTNHVTWLERAIAQLDEYQKLWQQTLEAAKASNAPPEVLTRIQTIIGQIKQAREAIERQRARALTVQNRIAAQEHRIADAQALITQARESALSRLFVKDALAVWSPEVRSRTAQDIAEEIRSSLVTQWAALAAYARRQMAAFFVHAVIFVGLGVGLHTIRRRLRPRLQPEAGATGTMLVLEIPFSVALVLSVLLSRWIYPQPPRLLWVTFGVLALIPAINILCRLIRRDLHPTLYALGLFYLLDQFRTLLAAVEILPRLLFLFEMFATMVFLIWLLRSLEGSPSSSPVADPWRRRIRSATRVALFVSTLAFAANTLGYVTLANLLGNALLSGAYLAPGLYALIELLDGLILIAFRLHPLRLLRVVQQHGALLRRRIRRALQWLAVLSWVLFVLERLLLRETLLNAIWAVLNAELVVGSLRVSLGDLLAFGITVWAAFLVSRFMRFLLNEEIYPRVHLRRGLPYTISTMLNYIILTIGFFVGIAALGLDMTKVTILAGAFTVGVGFGLQNIFNNFVSGLILLFERPVNVGDVVQIDDASGVVEHIGIRASIIRAPTGSSIIVPNGKLISERLINWTHVNRRHAIELPIAVAHGADPKHVIELLERTAASHPLVADDPPPQALVVKLGPDALVLELRAWTDRIEQWMQIRSELAIAISSALGAEKIAIR